MEVTCHPRLGGASQREAGVTGIKPTIYIKNEVIINKITTSNLYISDLYFSPEV